MTQAKQVAGEDGRLGFIDDARGIAVVLMIFWHTIDGWIRRDLQASHPAVLDTMRAFGGTAAPMFVMLAGVGAAMKLIGDAARGKPAWIASRELAARGMHVMATGYALRVFMWMVDDKAMYRSASAPAYVPLVLGLAALLVGLDRLGSLKRGSVSLVGGGAAVYAWGISRAFELEPRMAPFLLKVDVLQAIGLSLVVIALLDPWLGISRRPWLAVLIGFVVIIPTDLVAARMPGDLPPAIAAYLGRWDSPIGNRVAAFPIFPWLGYALAGVAVGNVFVHAAKDKRAQYVLLVLGACGGFVAAMANGPPVHRWVVPYVPILYKPLFMLHKVGFALVLIMLVNLLGMVMRRFPLRELGQTSMIIYWVHLEFAYGRIARPWKHSFDYIEWALAFAALTLAMALLARIRLRFPPWLAAQRALNRPLPSGSS